MITKNTLIFFLLFPFLLKGQEEHKWQFGVQLRPGFNGVASYHPDYTSQPNFSFAGYLSALRSLSPKISFNTGIGVGWNRYNRTQSNFIFDWDIDPAQGIISSSVLHENYNTRSIEIPLLFEFKLAKKFYAIAGLQLSLRQVIGIDRTITSSSGNSENLIVKDANPAFTASLLVGFGYTLINTDKISIRAAPLFKWNLTDPLFNSGNLYEATLQLGSFVRL